MPFRVRVYECDPRGVLSLPSLLNYMQEIAAAHTVKLHITIPELLPRGLTWMVSRQHIAIERYPEYMNKINMSTWIADHRGRFSIRDFALKDKTGNSLIRISSSWVLYDIRKRCIVNVDEELPLDSIFPERALEDKFPSLPVPENTQYNKELHVRQSDLDINRHANNRAIAEWAMEAIPPEFAESHEIVEMEISYKGQAFYEDVIISGCEIGNNKGLYTCLHHIKNKQSGQLITVARTRWRKTQKNSGGFR